MLQLQAHYLKSPLLRNSFIESQLLKRNPDFIPNLLSWLVKTPTVTSYRVNLLKGTASQFKSQVEKCLQEKYLEPPEVYLLSELPEVVCIGTVKSASYETNEDTKQIIVDVSCGAALLRGAHLYASGVLAMESNTQIDEEVLVFADLAGKCKKGTNVRYTSEHKLYIGLGRARLQRHHIFNAKGSCSGIAVEMLYVQSKVPSVGNLAGPAALLQNLPSMVCVRALEALPGETVLDMCAAPGNKTTHIAEMMQDQGVIVALDKAANRIKALQQKIVAENYQSIKSFVFDATKAFDKNANSKGIAAPPYAAHSFDRILLDAPCSALGNRPVLSINLSNKMLESFPQVQRRLFENAVALLKPQGTLVYSTCTITEEENECMVVWALKKFKELQLVEAQPRLGGHGLKNTGLTEEQRLLVQRFGVNCETHVDSVGFFIAKFKKLSIFE